MSQPGHKAIDAMIATLREQNDREKTERQTAAELQLRRFLAEARKAEAEADTAELVLEATRRQLAKTDTGGFGSGGGLAS